jgi:hypothetical protein
MIFFASAIIALITHEMSQPAATQIANQVPTTSAVVGCPPRATRVPPPAITPCLTPPTPAPAPTRGSPPPVSTMTIPALVHPLDTEEQVLKVVLDRDMAIADWDDGWCLETPRLQPERITIRWYPNMNAYDGSGAFNPGDEDPIWIVTIKGGVWIGLPGIGRSNLGGALYFVPQKTGWITRVGG